MSFAFQQWLKHRRGRIINGKEFFDKIYHLVVSLPPDEARKKLERLITKLNSSPALEETNGSAVVSSTLTDETCLAFVFRANGKKPKIYVMPEPDKI